MVSQLYKIEFPYVEGIRIEIRGTEDEISDFLTAATEISWDVGGQLPLSIADSNGNPIEASDDYYDQLTNLRAQGNTGWQLIDISELGIDILDTPTELSSLDSTTLDDFESWRGRFMEQPVIETLSPSLKDRLMKGLAPAYRRQLRSATTDDNVTYALDVFAAPPTSGRSIFRLDVWSEASCGAPKVNIGKVAGSAAYHIYGFFWDGQASVKCTIESINRQAAFNVVEQRKDGTEKEHDYNFQGGVYQSNPQSVGNGHFLILIENLHAKQPLKYLLEGECMGEGIV